MSKSKKRPVNDVEERSSPDVPKEAPPVPPSIRAGICPACNRPLMPPPADGVERLTATWTNPLIRFMNFHERKGPGSVPVVSDRLLRHADISIEGITESLQQRVIDAGIDYCNEKHYIGPVMVGAGIAEQSYRTIAEELGVSHPTVAGIVFENRTHFRNFLANRGIYPRLLAEVT